MNKKPPIHWPAPVPHPQAETLNRAAAEADARKYKAEPERITAMGDLT